MRLLNISLSPTHIWISKSPHPITLQVTRVVFHPKDAVFPPRYTWMATSTRLPLIQYPPFWHTRQLALGKPQSETLITAQTPSPPPNINKQGVKIHALFLSFLVHHLNKPGSNLWPAPFLVWARVRASLTSLNERTQYFVSTIEGFTSSGCNICRPEPSAQDNKRCVSGVERSH